MALQAKDQPGITRPDVELRDDDRFTGYEDDRERSHFGAFLMGGVVVTGGLLAFLYFDSDALNERANNSLTTSSISRIETPATAAMGSVRPSPSPQGGSENR